jgi:hypothetical protein
MRGMCSRGILLYSRTSLIIRNRSSSSPTLNSKKFVVRSYTKAHLPSEVLLLKVSQHSVGGGRESKGQFETNISSVLSSAELADRSSEPHLSHAEDRTHDTEAESSDGCNSRRKLVLVHVNAWVISSHASLVEDVL